MGGSLDCKTWDKGANQQEIVDNTADAFRTTCLQRLQAGAHDLADPNYLNRMSSHYFARYTEAFQFFFYGDLPSNYYPTPTSKDMLSARSMR